MKKSRQKLNVRVKVNIAIFGLLTLLFAILPGIMMVIWFPDTDEPQYGDNFSYILHDICPCSEDEKDCQGHYACGPDKANITYNLDNAPADLLAEAKQDHYYETQIESVRNGVIMMRRYLLCDIYYLLSFLSLVAGVIYWNHNKAVTR